MLKYRFYWNVKIDIELQIILKFLFQQIVSDSVLPKSLHFTEGFKSITSVALVRKTADEIRISTSFSSNLWIQENKLARATSNGLNNFARRVANGLGPDVAGGPPVVMCAKY
jgi:hypothetical protein